MNRQKLILMALLALLGLSLTYAFWTAPRQERVPSVTPSGSTSKPGVLSQKASPVDEERRVRLGLLAHDTDAFFEPERNIFRLTEVRPQPLLPVTPAPPPPPPVVVRPVPTPPPAPTAKPAPHFTGLGFLQKAGQKTAFLSANNEIYLVREGQRFGPGQEFQVSEITDKKLVFRRDSGGSPTTVPLVEESPPSSFVTRPSFKPPLRERRPTMFKPPQIPNRRNQQDAAPFEAPQPFDEPEVVDSPPAAEEDFPEEDVPEDDAPGNMSTLPLRSMIQ